ncbi:hypothetical protein V2J09_016425 [Rumex salicifolius]
MNFYIHIIYEYMASPGKRSRSGKSRIWSNEQKLVFLRILANWKNFRPKQSYKWPEILEDFNKQSGLQLSKDVFQNKLSTMKSEYAQWKYLLKGETGPGIDPITGFVQADALWCERKIKKNRDYKKFRVSGIPKEVEDLYHEVFDGSMATGEHLVMPGMVIQPCSLEARIENARVVMERTGETPGGRDIHLGSEGNQVELGASPLVGPCMGQQEGLSPAEGSPSSPALGSASQSKRQKRFISKQDIALDHISSLREQMEEYLSLVKKSITPPGSMSCSPSPSNAVSVVDAVTELYRMVNDGLIDSGSNLMGCALHFLLDENHRNMFMAIPKDEDRLALLRILCPVISHTLDKLRINGQTTKFQLVHVNVSCHGSPLPLKLRDYNGCKNILDGPQDVCMNFFRMESHVVLAICEDLKNYYGLRDTNVSALEKCIVGRSRNFSGLVKDLVCPLDRTFSISATLMNDRGYYPYFQVNLKLY